MQKQNMLRLTGQVLTFRCCSGHPAMAMTSDAKQDIYRLNYLLSSKIVLYVAYKVFL
jgi:hypothetical protein